MAENEFTYWAFLSYSQEDNCGKRPDAPDVSRLCWGDWWGEVLKTFSVPADFVGQANARAEIIPGRIDPVFQDGEEQPGDAGLSEGVRQALEQSRCLIVICSPRSAKSLHVNEAVRCFKQLGRGSRILPVVIAGEPHASGGSQSGFSPEDECFVPALLHSVKPDGTFDTSRPEAGFIFADARQGAAKQEILAQEHPGGQIELETAKIQLIAGLLGVGFNGLWAREQQRRFAEVPIQAPEAGHPIQESRNPSPEAQAQMLAAQEQARAAQQQIQDLQNQAQEAESQAREARNQAREALDQIAEARSQAREAESRVLEAQRQAQEAQLQLEAARNEVREAQKKVLEIQNLPQDVQGQIQEAQDKAREIQSQLDEARKQVRDAQNKILEEQGQSRETQGLVQEFQGKAKESETQLAEARNQAQEALSRLEESQVKVREAEQQARAAQAKIQEMEDNARQTQSQLELARTQSQAAESSLLEARKQAREIQIQLEEARNLSGVNQQQVRELQAKTQAARHLTKVFAILAVLALMSAGIALRERKSESDSQAPAKPEAAEVRPAAPTSAPLDRMRIQEALQKIAGAGQDQSRLLEELVARIPTEEMTNTLALLNELKPAPGESVYTLLFQRWAAKAPLQAIEQRQQIPGRDADARILSATLAAWSAEQPEAPVKWLESQPDSDAVLAGTWRNTMLAGLFDRWAAKDLEAATTACQQLPEGPAREKAMASVLSRRMAKAPASAAALVNQLAPGDTRSKAVAELCRHWAGTDVPAALAWAQSLSDEAERVQAIHGVIAEWARQDPPSAGQFVRQHPELSGTAFGEIAAAWFQRDLTAATNWVASLPEGEKKDEARLALVDGWAQSDPKGMIAFALGLPAGEIRTRYLSAATGQLALRDLPGTVEMLQPVSDADLRQRLLEQAARNCALPQLNQAAKYIAAMPAGGDQKAAVTGLLARWTPADPETAVSWLGTFPETNAQPGQVQSVLKAWAQSEPAAAARWLAHLPADKADEGTVSAFLEGAAGKYPEFASHWTQSATNEVQRQKYQVQVARQWMKTAPAAALQWVDGLELPEEIKEVLRDSLDNF